MKYITPCSEGGMMSGIIIVDETTDNNRFQGLLLLPRGKSIVS